ncbi:MAG: hypothetical protein R3C59_13335 [Planctomycetaceae bacterium]
MVQEPSAVRPPPSRLRRTAFRLTLLLLTWLTCELLAMAGLWLTSDEVATADPRETAAQIASGAAASDGATEVIHPYLGWVHNPQRALTEVVFGEDVPVNPLGFQDTNTSIHKRSADKFILGITGGSVAWHMSIAGLQTLTQELQNHPALNGRTIEVVRLATSGYKQPQQLMALNFIHVLGGEFDAIVNVDGYNEVALAITENAGMGTAISYPRSWHARVISSLDPASFADAGRLLELRSGRQQMARNFLASPFRWSAVRTLTWLIRDRKARSELLDLGLEVSRVRKGSFVNHGPVNGFETKQTMQQAVIDLWFRSSLQMNRLCGASNCLYLHVLQPNQYMEGSKPLSPEELEDCYVEPGDPPGDAIRELYPLLVRTGDTLCDAGVSFSDQTMLFADVTDTIYADHFCHYNKRGNIMLAQAVVTELRRLLDDSMR